MMIDDDDDDDDGDEDAGDDDDDDDGDDLRRRSDRTFTCTGVFCVPHTAMHLAVSVCVCVTAMHPVQLPSITIRMTNIWKNCIT